MKKLYITPSTNVALIAPTSLMTMSDSTTDLSGGNGKDNTPGTSTDQEEPAKKNHFNFWDED